MKVNVSNMSREDWLKERMKSIGGSDVGNILGVGYQSPLYIYYTKVGERDTDVEVNSRMEAGNRLEDVVAKWCADEHGLTIRNDNFMHYKKSNKVLSANVDKIIVDKSERGNGILEVKTTSSFNIKKYEKGIPYNYMLQLQHYLNVMGLQWGMVTMLVEGHDLRTETFYRDEALINHIERTCMDFWNNHVVPRIPPEPTHDEDLFLKYTEVNESLIEATEIINDDVDELRLVKGQISDLKKREKELSVKVKDYIGNNDTLTNADGDVIATWKMTKPSVSFNSQALKKEDIETYRKYAKERKASRRFILKEV